MIRYGTKNYSDYTNRLSGLIGIPYDSATDDEKNFIMGFFDTNIKQVWDEGPWLSVSPYGEARFAGNLLYYPNDLTKTAYWTATNTTPTTSSTNPQYANPCDGRLTATFLAETAATGEHKVSQVYQFLPSINYQFSAYVRANSRSYAYMKVNDGVNDYTAFFNVSTGVIGTYSSNMPNTPTIVQCNNGYWLVTIYVTTASTAGTGACTLNISTDGSTLSYAGNTAYGLYAWGVLLLQTTFANPTSGLVAWDQLGESEINAVFQVWKDSPANAINPRPQGYELTPNGIQMVGTAGYAYGTIYSSFPNGYTPSQFPVYLQYRKKVPEYFANDYSAQTAYAVDEQVLFEDSRGASNFYKCVAATTAGQDPESAPTYWELLEIPEEMFMPVLYGAYADWLRMDGQIGKAEAADRIAQKKKDDAHDVRERQQGWVQPMKVQTHVTSQYRR